MSLPLGHPAPGEGRANKSTVEEHTQSVFTDSSFSFPLLYTLILNLFIVGNPPKECGSMGHRASRVKGSLLKRLAPSVESWAKLMWDKRLLTEKAEPKMILKQTTV